MRRCGKHSGTSIRNYRASINDTAIRTRLGIGSCYEYRAHRPFAPAYGRALLLDPQRLALL